MSFSNSERDLDLAKWKVADLKKELKLRGLSAEGKKNDLVLRLQLALGGSGLLDDAINDQDELLDEDVLMDEEVDALEDSDLKSDSLDNIDRGLESEDIKRKSNDNDNQMQSSKKVTLNRNFVSSSKDENVVEGKENQTHTESKNIEKTKISKVRTLTLQERLERRAVKFGLAVTSEAKKEARAARFGLATKSSKIGGSGDTSIDVLKKRAERFGTTLPGSILEKVEIEERKKKREERFGKVEAVSTPLKRNASIAEQKKQLRAERFKLKS